MTLNPPAPVPPQRRGWWGFLTLLLVLLALGAGFWLGGGGKAFATGTGGNNCSSSWRPDGTSSTGCTFEKFWSPSTCGQPGHTCTEAYGSSGCGVYCAPPSGGGTSCNPNTIQYCWASPTCGGDNATNGCGNAVYSSSCNSGCGGGGPTCTPTGTITTNFKGCDGICKGGYFDQTNSCGTVTKPLYKSQANGCTSTADGCPSTCTPNGTYTYKFISCSNTCDFNIQGKYNSCGGLVSTQETWDPTTCSAACSNPPPACNGGTVSNGVCTCPSGDTLVNGTCTASTTPAPTCNGGTVSNGVCTCPSGESLVNGTCTAPAAPTCTAGPVNSSGPFITGCASQGEFSTVTDHSQTTTCSNGTSTTRHWSSTGTQATTGCQPIIKIDGTKPLACAAAPDTGSAWSSYTYQHCLSYLGNAVDCGPTLTYTPTKPYQVQGGQFPEPVYNPVACPVPIAVGP